MKYPNLRNLTGEKFGLLLANYKIATTKYIYYFCTCDCENTALVTSFNLNSGKAKSCGCFKNMMTAKRALKHGYSKPNMVRKVYRAWSDMRQRCSNENGKFYKHYGGRGIKVCDRWINSFENFLADMGEAPKDKSLDRIDCNGDYEPSNCRWATQSEQNKNRRPYKRKTKAQIIIERSSP